MAETLLSESVPDRPLDAPPAPVDTRALLASEFLRGAGVEVGALHLPMAVPAGARVTYVDRMSVEDLRSHYPELEPVGFELTPVDVVDDGERLEKFEDGSIDFLVANHFMEHCEDPIGTIETHLGKLRPGGVLFYAVPDKRYTFDFRRPRTPLGHVIADYENGPGGSRGEHYREWARLVFEPGSPAPSEEQALAEAGRLEREGYSIHFHVWTEVDLLELFLHCQERFGSFDLEAVRRSGIENIMVLRKHADPVPQALVPDNASSVGLVQTDSAPQTSLARMPLPALRAKLDPGSRDAHWTVDVSGSRGRSMVQAADSAIEFPLRLAGPVSFSARVTLVDLDWRDSRGVIRPWVAGIDETGQRHELWSGELVCAADGGNGEPVRVECVLPAATRSLQLGLELLPPTSGMWVGRALWLDPGLVDPAAPVWGHEPQSKHRSEPGWPSMHPEDAPFISVLTPVHNPPVSMLHEAIWSVRRQTFTDWELCLCDDGSTDPDVIAALRAHVEDDSRIRLVRRDQGGGISVATNAALELARGEYIALLDHDDWLEQDALEAVAKAIDADPNVDMLYSDEDVVAAGQRIGLGLKAGWSPDTFCSVNYTCHLGVYRRELAVKLGGFRPEFDGAQDYDFVLRLIEVTDRVRHIPQSLYHWRAHASSAAGDEDAKPFAYPAGRRAVAAHFERTGRAADVQFGSVRGMYRVVRTIAPAASVALVLPLAPEGPQAEALAEAARSWTAQSLPSCEIVITGPRAMLDPYARALRGGGVDPGRITAVANELSANPIAALASAVAAVDAEHLVLMETPAVGLTHDWMGRLVGYCTDPAIGAAGAVVLAPDGRIEHAGVAVTHGRPLFLHHGHDGHMAGLAAINLSAVTGVVATRRETFERLEGLRSELGEMAFVDYCLRASRNGLRIVIVPDAQLRAMPRTAPLNDLPAIWRLRHEWGSTVRLDPYYNPRYRQDCGDFIPKPGPANELGRDLGMPL